MPRQDVPYGGAICRLKERIAEIWDKLDQKLHSINGVEGDGGGNVEIVSGNDAVVIANDQVGHKIEVSLNNSKLPAAAVSSVNGQTGAVRLDAADIPSDANSNVQLDINWSKTAINDCFDSITTEQDTRQAADDELQGNINSVQASIPGAAAAAVANDPTVAQLAADVPGKLDKISSGSTLKAYTHTGQAQGETGVVNGIDANSIGLRDASGRMQAADPASGATDKTLVTANWVSQTGAGKPNNLIHDNGNELIDGQKLFAKPAAGAIHEARSNNQNGWRKLLVSNTFANNNEEQIAIFDIMDTTSALGRFGTFRLVARNNHLKTLGLLFGNYEPTALKATIDSNNQVIIWGYYYRTITALRYENHAGTNTISFKDSETIAIFNEPTTSDYTEVITGA